MSGTCPGTVGNVSVSQLDGEDATGRHPPELAGVREVDRRGEQDEIAGDLGMEGCEARRKGATDAVAKDRHLVGAAGPLDGLRGARQVAGHERRDVQRPILVARACPSR